MAGMSSLGGIVGSYWGPVGSAAGSAIGSWFDQDEANQFNKESARDNRDFQERMSNTSWQRGISDMKSAGVNPMLAFQQGGATTPGGSAASYPVGQGAANMTSAASAQQASTAAAVAEQQIKTESFKTKVAQNEAIKGNYAIMQLAGTLDAAMQITGKLGADALAELAKPQIRAGLEELRAAFASAKNDAQVYEALNSRAVNMALEMLGKLTGSGAAISGAVDRYRARSQRGDIINLNKD